jgi:hypothetical protein
MRGFFLKMSLVAGLAAGLLFLGGAFSSSDAMPVASNFSDTGQAAFKVVDNFGLDGDELVKLSFISTLSGLQYKYAGTAWTDISIIGSPLPGLYSGTLDVITGDDHGEVVYLRTGSGNATAGMLFRGFDDPLWNSIVLDFESNGIPGLVFATPGMGDHVAPVPIPPTVWIFGSALLGLVGIRRKITH